MGAPNSTYVSAVKPLATGGVLVAPYGTTLPPESAPSGSVSINSAFVALGYMSQDDNVSASEETSNEDAFAWGGDLVLNVTKSRKETYSFTAIEQNVEAWKLRYGDSNVSGTEANASVIHDGSSFDGYHSIIVAGKLKDGRVKLTVIPKAKLETVGTVSNSDGEPLGYNMTFAAVAYSGSKTSYDLYYTPTSVTTTT